MLSSTTFFRKFYRCASRQSLLVRPVDSLNLTCRWLRENPQDSAMVSLEYSGCSIMRRFAYIESQCDEADDIEEHGYEVERTHCKDQRSEIDAERHDQRCHKKHLQMASAGSSFL